MKRPAHRDHRRRISALFCTLLVAPILALLSSPLLGADPALPSDVTFNLRRSFPEELMDGGPNGHSMGARWNVKLKMGEHSAVHDIAADCELHVAAKRSDNRLLANPSGIVVEPPNVCKLRIPQMAQSGKIKDTWASYFDTKVKDKTCEVTGFPRIYSEHSSGGSSTGSNPDHVVEVHPQIGMHCDGEDAADFLPLLRVFPKMRRITDNSAEACLDKRQLFVRAREKSGAVIYEFLEQGAKGFGGSCGNFVVVEADISKEYLRELSNGGDHVALARAWVNGHGPWPLKIYTYKGTPEDAAIAALMADPDEGASIELQLHGLLTYDYFTIVQTLQKKEGGQFVWLPVSELEEYKEIRNPLALVVFGKAVD